MDTTSYNLWCPYTPCTIYSFNLGEFSVVHKANCILVTMWINECCGHETMQGILAMLIVIADYEIVAIFEQLAVLRMISRLSLMKV